MRSSIIHPERNLWRNLIALCLASAGAATISAYEITSPNPENQGRFGRAIAFVPDVDGDGRPDLLIGAPQEDAGGVSNAGRAYLFSGASGALLRTFNPPTPQINGNYGWAVAGLQDITGDGRGDVAIGAPNEDTGVATPDAGRVHIYNGVTGVPVRLLTSISDQSGGRFGWSLATFPDVTGDGRPDLAIGAPYENPEASPEDAGRVYTVNPATGAVLTTCISPNEQFQGRFGWSLSAVPDSPGVYRGFILVGAPFENPGGSPSEAGRAYMCDALTGLASVTFQSNIEEIGGQFGYSVAGIQDVTMDGLADAVIGAWQEDPGASPNNSGRALVMNGSTGTFIRALSPPGPLSDDFFGASVASVGDINGDARGDVWITAFGAGTSPDNRTGRAFLFSGIDGSILQTITSLNPVHHGRFGEVIAAGPDLTGDGKPDIAVWSGGEPDALSSEGRVNTFSGVDGGPFLTPTPSPTPSPTETETPTPTPTPAYDGRPFGDFDDSGCTDLADFLFLLDNWQTELNGVLVGLDDFLGLLDNWLTGENCT